MMPCWHRQRLMPSQRWDEVSRACWWLVWHKCQLTRCEAVAAACLNTMVVITLMQHVRAHAVVGHRDGLMC